MWITHFGFAKEVIMTKKRRCGEVRETNRPSPQRRTPPQISLIAGIDYPDFANQDRYYFVATGTAGDRDSICPFYLLLDDGASKGKKVLCLFSSEDAARDFMEGPVRHPTAYMDVLGNRGQAKVVQAAREAARKLEPHWKEEFFIYSVGLDGLVVVLGFLETLLLTLNPGTGREITIVAVEA